MPLSNIASMAIAHRNYFVSIGWPESDCSIGTFDGTTKLADDSGAVNYTLDDRGRILRNTLGTPGKLIEFIACRMACDISRFNGSRN